MKPLSPKDKIAAMNKIFTKALDIAEAKSHDYSGTVDSMDNFRDFGYKGIIVRLSDKMKRVVNYAKSATHKVSNESLEDNLLDIINYAALTLIMKQEEEAEVKDKAAVKDQNEEEWYQLISAMAGNTRTKDPSMPHRIRLFPGR